MVIWRNKELVELPVSEFYKVAYERIRTFVIAQDRPYQEIDETDPVAHHILGMRGKQLVAYARVFPEGDHVTFGRVLTIPEVRGQGLGRQLMTQIEAEIRRDFANCPIQIEAQIDKQGFYEKFGYVAQGPVFDFNGSPHIRMDKAPLGVSGK
ncbi:GNAT family N-acetyltransferase [Levilactobacillus huananensis]|uniref:GNAT family N-acetyltransferase n=1 Tax=Levilactobacillus huananensis TaxID=2486019 RepID=UPI000F775CF0|nr:GNAT family N-acetyltransferase [Levilactobacillus huananensis]